MTIAIEYKASSIDTTIRSSEEYEDACSILVPVDVINIPGVLVSVMAGGIPLSEDTNPAWDVGATYAAVDRVYSPVTHRVYESAKDNNTGRDPTDPLNRYNAAGIATWWIEVGPTNLAAMFDGMISSQTSAPSPLVITLRPGAFNGFALFAIDADTISETVRSGPGGDIIFYEPATQLDAAQPSDYYEYFFDRPKPLTQIIRSGIEAYSDAEITLTLTKGSGNVKLGMFAIGDLRPVGIPQRDAKVSPQTFTYVAQDAFGNAVVKKRPNATNMSITAVMDKSEANAVKNTVDEILGTPCVVVGSEADEYEWLTTFGMVSADFDPSPYPYVKVSLTVKGFI